MKRKHLTICILLFVACVIAACNQPAALQPAEDPTTDSQTAAAIEPTATPEAEEISPLPEAANSPLSEPAQAAAPEEAPVLVGEFSDETGAVTGLLRSVHNDGDVRPLAGAVIGLGALVVDEEDEEKKIGAAYSGSDSPRTTIQEDGTFIINDVPPGDYAVILDSIVSQSLMSFPDGSGDFLITVEAGEQIDLEILSYETLPYPGFVNTN